MDWECLVNKKANFAKLKDYGFVQQGQTYEYKTMLDELNFCMTVQISAVGEVETKVIDCDSAEEYVLHRTLDADGAFVGRVRAAHIAVLQDIAEKCFDENVFKSLITRQIIDYMREAYGDELEFLWPKFPDNAICRRQDTGKWYALIMTVSKDKLGIESQEKAEVIGLRLQPQLLAKLLDGKRYFPGYHMNKKHWYTMLLDGSVAAEEICRRIDESYKLAVK